MKLSSKKKIAIAVLVFLVALIFLLCFRPIVAFRTYTPLDDLCYEVWLAKLLHAPLSGCVASSFPPGAAVAWLPAGVMAVGSAWVSGSTFADDLPVFIGILSFLYWVGSLWILVLLTKRTLLPLLLLLSVPLLYYSTHRTTLVHPPEFFLSLLLVYLVQKKSLFTPVLVSILLTAVRLNDFPAIFIGLFPLISEVHFKKLEMDQLKTWVFRTGVAISVLILGYILWVAIHQGYHSTNIFKMLGRFTPERLTNVIVGGDWGLLWTAPLWLWIWFIGVFKFKKITPLARLGLFWMTIELLICIGWKGNGSDFGYRYLIGSYAGAWLVASEFLEISWFKVGTFSLSIVNSVWLFWLTWVYKEWPSVTPFPSAEHTWTHPDLQLNALKLLPDVESWTAPLLHSPFSALYASIFEPQSALALTGGWMSSSFFMLALVTVLALALMTIALVGIFRELRK